MPSSQLSLTSFGGKRALGLQTGADAEDFLSPTCLSLGTGQGLGFSVRALEGWQVAG